MRIVKKNPYKRYACSSEDIAKQLKQINENYRCLNPEAEINVEVIPNPGNIIFDGKEQEFEVRTSIIYK